jgi:hypothetical protein
MTGVHSIKPIASKHENGRIAVYIGATYSYLPRESALSLFQQLAVALDIPYSEGVALFAAKVLQTHRNDGEPGDIDGGEAQELALESELLEPFERGAEPCGDGCYCEAGDRCLRLSAIGTALVAMLDASDETKELRL